MWQGVIDTLADQRSSLLRMSLESATHATALAPAGGPADVSTSAASVELVVGRDITITFDAARCIHSRHCVLDAPAVFRANTPGQWIHPEARPAETVAAVAISCPSGAIRFERHDGGANEAAPEVNQLKTRENGPYAFHAPIIVDGVADGFRATLCRCGLSKRKPWCDGSHAGGGFVATGEPLTADSLALAARGGPIRLTSTRNGPLRAEGNLEVCSGTGRTVSRVTEATLCRCGHSKNKPFCDGSHRVAGFTAEGT